MDVSYICCSVFFPIYYPFITITHILLDLNIIILLCYQVWSLFGRDLYFTFPVDFTCGVYTKAVLIYL